MRQIGGCTSTLAAWLGVKQDDLSLEGIEQVPILTQIQDYHFVLHWLHEHMPRYVMAALVARVNPDRPEMLWKKYVAKFADDVQNKRVLWIASYVVSSCLPSNTIILHLLKHCTRIGIFICYSSF